MLEIIGHIDSTTCKFLTPHSDRLKDFFNKHRGKDIELTVKVKRKKRSNDQNEYYHAVCVPMVQAGMYELGNEMSLAETHEFLKKEFNYKEVPSKHGELIKLPQSTTKLNTVEFMEYIEKIQRFAAEYLGVVIPDPNAQSVLIATSDPEVNATIIDKATI